MRPAPNPPPSQTRGTGLQYQKTQPIILPFHTGHCLFVPSSVWITLLRNSCWIVQAGGDSPMAHAEQSRKTGHEPLPELVPLHQCLAALELTPAVRQTVATALAQSQDLLHQRLQQMAWQADRCALLGEIAARMVHDIRNPLNAIFLHADVVEEEIQRPTDDSQAQVAASVADIRTEVTHLYDLIQDYLT